MFFIYFGKVNFFVPVSYFKNDLQAMFVKTRQINFFSISFFSRASYLVTVGKGGVLQFLLCQMVIILFPL